MDFGDRIGQELLRLGNLHESLVNTFKNANNVEDPNFQNVLVKYLENVIKFHGSNVVIPLAVEVAETILNPTIQQKEDALTGSVPATDITTQPTLADRMAAIRAKAAETKTEETKSW